MSVISVFFSSVLAFFMSVFALFLPAQPENVTVSVRPVTTESAGITYEFENNTRRTINRPDVISIEKSDGNGNWQKVNLALGRTDIAYTLRHGASTVDSAEFGDLYGEYEGLEKGEYRINLRYTLQGDGTTAYASGEFTVTDPS